MKGSLRTIGGKGLKALGGRMAGLSGKPLRTRRTLAFVEKAPDPMRDMAPADTAEQQINGEVEAVRIGIVERMKKDAARKKAAVAADDYFVVAFESGEQATAFLRAVRYDKPDDAFIDGTMLAKLLNIELPAAVNQRRALKTVHDTGLSSLVTRWR